MLNKGKFRLGFHIFRYGTKEIILDLCYLRWTDSRSEIKTVTDALYLLSHAVRCSEYMLGVDEGASAELTVPVHQCSLGEGCQESRAL